MLTDCRKMRLTVRRIATATFVLSFVFLGVYHVKLARYPVYDWLGLAAAILVYAFHLYRGRVPKVPRGLLVAASLVLLSGLFTIPRSDAADSQLLHLFLLIYIFYIWISLPSQLIGDRGELRWLYWALSISMGVTSSFAILQGTFGYALLSEEPFWGRMPGLTRHPNELGIFCALVLPLALCLLQTTGRIGARIALGGLATSGLVGVLLSGSMTGTIASLVTMSTYLWMMRAKTNWRAFALMPIAILGYLAAGSAIDQDALVTSFDRLKEFAESEEGRSTLGSRLEGNSVAWLEIMENPFIGHGYFSEVSGVGIIVHNGLLRAWYEGGIFCALGVLVAVVSACISIYRAKRQLLKFQVGASDQYFAASVSSLAGFVSIVSVSPLLFDRSSWFPVSIAFVVANIVSRDTKESTQKDPDKNSSERSEFA